jgi:hypothetical protein
MWGSGGGGSGMGVKSTMIKREDFKQSNGCIGQSQRKQIMQNKNRYGH